MTKPVEYIIKGGMCMTCEFKWTNCDYLPFEQMPIIRQIDHIAYVKCTEYVKDE